jgi:hypothetical protein
MSGSWRVFVVVAVGAWMLGTVAPQLRCVWQPCPRNGLSVDYEGTVVDVAPDSPAAQAAVVPGDQVVAPLPRELYRDPPHRLTFRLLHSGTIRSVTLDPRPTERSVSDKLRLLALSLAYFIFLVVGSAVLLLRPSTMTWSFYFYCVLRRFGDLGVYWPGSNAFFWFNFFALATLGGATCAFVLMFALLFPRNRLDGWRRPFYRVGVALAIALPIAWLYAFLRLTIFGTPEQSFVKLLYVVTEIVYLCAAVVFLVTLLQSRGDERLRLRWILVFPAVLIMHVVAISSESLPGWFSDALIALGACIPLAVAYAVVRRRVFDIEFAISRALVYGAITSIIAGTFILLDWFMSRQFAQTRFTLTAEIIVALALGSWLNMLHKNVDRFVDSTFFRQRHLAEERLARAAAALHRAESHEAVDRFLVHEPVQALNLTSAALFHCERTGEPFVRRVAVHWDRTDELTPEDPLVLHLLAEGAPVRLADVSWGAEELPKTGTAVLATPILLRDELVTIVLYGPHRNGADIDPDEVRSLLHLAESAGAAYDHIEARVLRARVESLVRERDAKAREIALLLTQVKGS